jgi:photosystem II stability/assembly factor-like uncharacterized protein
MLGKLRASNLWIDHGQESCLYWYFNWVHMKRLFFWVVVSTFFYQCQKESWVPPHWEQQPVPLVMDFNSVYFVDSLRGFLAGGEPWKEGCLLSTVDGGRSWVLDTLLVGHKMEHITADSLGNVLAVGQYGHCFERSSIANTWTKYRIDYVWHRGAALVDGKRAVIVSGESFSFGEIRSFGPDYFWALDTQQMLPVQLDAVWAIDAQNWVACGLGWVIRSSDGGASWERLPVTDDWFTAIHFPTQKIGYICGRTGYLLKTTDGGRTWQQIRQGGAFGEKRKVFRSVWFSTADKGLLVGEDGIIWRTLDGGESWSPVEGMPSDVNYTDVMGVGHRSWITAEEGGVFVLED